MGLPYSGTTLLNFIISSHSKCLGLGEASKVFHKRNHPNFQNRTCTCQSKYNDCLFWGDIESKICSTHPHNFVFELLSDSGIFAPIILVISLFSLVFNKIKRVNNKFFKTLIPIYSILLFFPLIPTGSFFTSFHMVLTWFSLGFLYSIEEK